MGTSYDDPLLCGAGEPSDLGQEIVVLVVDTRAWTREALARALEAACSDFRVRCFESASDLARAGPAVPQMVILLNSTGIALADCGVTTAVATARSFLPGVSVVAIADSLDADDNTQRGRRRLERLHPELFGAPTGRRRAEVRGSRRNVLYQPSRFSPALDAVLSRGSPAPQIAGETDIPEPVNGPAAAVSVTRRESAVLDELCQGKSNKQIARELGLREPTIKVHVRHIMRKLGVANRTQVALLAAHLRSPSGDT